MYVTATRLSDNKTLYFYDLDSYTDYKDVYEEDLSDISLVLDVPFGEKIIDISEERNELRQAFSLAGLPLDKNLMKNLYSHNENTVDPDEAVKEISQISKQTFDINDKDELVENNDDNPLEISIRKNKLLNVELFKSFYTALEDDRKKLVRDTFKSYNLDIDCLDDYIDKEINMDIDIYLNNYDTHSQFKQAEREYKKTDEYLQHENFMNAIDKSYDAVRYADDADDAKKIKGE